MSNDDLLQQGIDLAKRGNTEQASILFAKVVKANPESEQAWLWLGRCRTVPKEKRYCFNKVLSINPDHEDARRELADLEFSESRPSHSIPTTIPLPPTPVDATSLSIQSTETAVAPPKKNWVRRTIYLLVGIMVGIYVGRYIGNSLSALGFFDKIDAAIALRTIHVPEFNAFPAPEIEPTPTISLTDSYEKRLEKA